MKTTEKNKKNKMNTTERYEFNKEKWFDSVGDFNVNYTYDHKYLREGLHVQPDMMVDCINIVEDLMIEEFGKLFNYEINIVTDSVVTSLIIDRVDPSRKDYNPQWNKTEYETLVNNQTIMRPTSTNLMIGISVTMNLPKKLQDLKRDGNGWKPKKWGVSDNNYEWRVMVIHPSMSTICNYHVGTQHHHDVMDYFTIYSREKRLCELGI